MTHKVMQGSDRIETEAMTTIGYFQAIILSGACGSGKTYASMVLLRQVIMSSYHQNHDHDGGHVMKVLIIWK